MRSLAGAGKTHWEKAGVTKRRGGDDACRPEIKRSATGKLLKKKKTRDAKSINGFVHPRPEKENDCVLSPSPSVRMNFRKRRKKIKPWGGGEPNGPTFCETPYIGAQREVFGEDVWTIETREIKSITVSDENL